MCRKVCQPMSSPNSAAFAAGLIQVPGIALGRHAEATSGRAALDILGLQI